MPLDSNRDYSVGAGGSRSGVPSTEPEAYSEFGEPAGKQGWLRRIVSARVRAVARWLRRIGGRTEQDAASALAQRNPAGKFIKAFRRGHPPQQAGWRDGRALEPPAGTGELSAYEEEALVAFQSTSEEIALSIRRDTDTLVDNIAEHASDPTPLIRGITASVQGGIERQAEDSFPHLRRADEEVVRARGARGEAYAKQGLAAPPTPGPTMPWSRVIAVLLCFTVAEALPTVWALRDVVPGGIHSAAWWGLAIAGFNVALSFWCGFELGPLAKSSFRVQKMVGWTLTTLFVAFVLLWQWGVAAFRYLVRDTDAAPLDVAARVGAELSKSPLLWTPDLFGWMLFAAGVVFAITAFRKGFELALSRVDRDYIAALEAVRTIEGDLEAACEEIAARGEGELKALLEQAKRQRDDKHVAAGVLSRLLRAFEDQHTRLTRGLHGVRADYWRAQKQTRGGVPLPAHVHGLINLRNPMEALNANALAASLEQWSSRVVAADAQVTAARSRITLSVRRVLEGLGARVLRSRGEAVFVPDTEPSEPPARFSTDLGSGAEPIPSHDSEGG